MVFISIFQYEQFPLFSNIVFLNLYVQILMCLFKVCVYELLCMYIILTTLRETSSQTNVILQYKLLAAILSAVFSVIQQSYYVLLSCW